MIFETSIDFDNKIRYFDYTESLPVGLYLISSVHTLFASMPNWMRANAALKGHGNEADFLGFLQKLGPHRSLTLPFEPFRFWLRIRGDIRNRKKQLPDSASRRIGESANRRLSDSVSRGVADSPTWRVGELTTHRLAESGSRLLTV